MDHLVAEAVKTKFSASRPLIRCSTSACGGAAARRGWLSTVDTEKKELVGAYRNGGRECRPKGQPERVKVHDFVDKTLGKAVKLIGHTTTKSGLTIAARRPRQAGNSRLQASRVAAPGFTRSDLGVAGPHATPRLPTRPGLALDRRSDTGV